MNGDYNTNKTITNDRAFSVIWTVTPTINQVKPYSILVPAVPVEDVKPVTYLPSPYTDTYYPVGLIQSRREPYAVEEYWGQYGNLNSKLGTNLGTNVSTYGLPE